MTHRRRPSTMPRGGEHDRSVDPERRAAWEKKIAEEGTEAAQTIIGYGLKAGKATLGGGAVLADLKTLFPESFAEAWSKLWELFG